MSKITNLEKSFWEIILAFRGSSIGIPARCWERGPDDVTSNRFCSLICGTAKWWGHNTGNVSCQTCHHFLYHSSPLNVEMTEPHLVPLLQNLSGVCVERDKLIWVLDSDGSSCILCLHPLQKMCKITVKILYI